MAKLEIHIDEIPLSFGKHKGRSPADISDDDPGYIVWLYENIEPKIVSKALCKSCEHDVQDCYGPDLGDAPW